MSLQVHVWSVVTGASETVLQSHSSLVAATAFVQPKIVSKAFTPPLVTDAYNKVASLSSPLQTYVDTTVASLSPILASGFTTVKATGVEEKIPTVVYTKMKENCAPVVEGMKAEEIVEKKAEGMVKEAEEMVENVVNVEPKRGEQEARTSTNFEQGARSKN